MRDCLLANFTGDKSGHVWKDLWTLAQQTDFQIAAANSQGGYAAVMQLLSAIDALELALRRLASYIHQERTGDVKAATHIQGTQPPGCKADIAPTWLVTENTLVSKNELQRDERLDSMKRRHPSDSSLQTWTKSISAFSQRRGFRAQLRQSRKTRTLDTDL